MIDYRATRPRLALGWRFWPKCFEQIPCVGPVGDTCPVANWAPLRTALADVERSVTYTWAELDELVGGLPRSAYEYGAFWKGARTGWPGFTTAQVRVGHSVTFVRIGTAAAGAKTVSARAERPGDSPAADVILVGCVKTKLTSAAPAQDLYVSPLFRKGRGYAEAADVPWFILSAQHGLVSPDEVLEPYDLRLSKTSREYRREWGSRVVSQLLDAVESIEGSTIEVHAGSAYADAIREGLRAAGALVVEPLAGLALGPRLAWYGGGPTAPGTATAGPDVEDLVEQLTDDSNAMAPSEFLATGASQFRSPGLYSWWVDADGAADLAAGLGHPVNEGLIYAGLAGATRSGGRKSSNTLWGRIQSMHLGGRHEFSTFRLSLGSILAQSAGAAEIDEVELTRWMHAHLRLIAVPVADADTLGDVESTVLTALNPPLNLDKVTRDERRRRLSELRKQYGRKKRRRSGAGEA